jgi:enamine deaminase RidA (YjgF/YER057c/UK114 family)
VTDRDQYIASGAALGEAYREVLGRVYPAMSAVQVCALMEANALVEIEATAIVPDASA